MYTTLDVTPMLTDLSKKVLKLMKSIGYNTSSFPIWVSQEEGVHYLYYCGIRQFKIQRNHKIDVTDLSDCSKGLEVKTPVRTSQFQKLQILLSFVILEKCDKDFLLLNPEIFMPSLKDIGSVVINSDALYKDIISSSELWVDDAFLQLCRKRLSISLQDLFTMCSSYDFKYVDKFLADINLSQADIMVTEEDRSFLASIQEGIFSQKAVSACDKIKLTLAIF